jgi:hypothetical protein
MIRSASGSERALAASLRAPVPSAPHSTRFLVSTTRVRASHGEVKGSTKREEVITATSCVSYMGP